MQRKLVTKQFTELDVVQLAQEKDPKGFRLSANASSWGGLAKGNLVLHVAHRSREQMAAPPENKYGTPKLEVWKMSFLFKGVISGFHVVFFSVFCT